MEMVQFERENIRFLCPLNLPVSNDKEYYDRQHDSLCGVYVVSSCQFPMLPIPRYQPGGPRMKRNESVQICAWTPYVTALLIVTNALHALNALTSGFRGK